MQAPKLPRIGITTQIIRRSKWYKELGTLGFDTIEINRQNSVLYCNLYFLEKIKRYTQGYVLSLHSGSRGIFQRQRSFTEANLAMLRAEVDICSILNARQLVFHLSDGIASASDKRRLQEIIDDASDQGIRMMYEPNSHMVADYAYDALDSFPRIGLALDIGHLNCGHGGGTLGCEMDHFVRNVHDRVEYLHVSNNNGMRDEHTALSEGTLKWRHLLDSLDLTRVTTMIIEVRSMDRVAGTYCDMLDYMQGRYPDYTLYN